MENQKFSQFLKVLNEPDSHNASRFNRYEFTLLNKLMSHQKSRYRLGGFLYLAYFIAVFTITLMITNQIITKDKTYLKDQIVTLEYQLKENISYDNTGIYFSPSVIDEIEELY